MTTETRSLYSQLPAIDRLLRDSSFLSLRDTYGHTRVVELLRQMLDEAREVIRGSQTLPAWCENWAQEVDARLTKEAQSALRPVINLTGTVLHTNLGRALQAEAAVEAVAQAMRSPVTLEYDLDDAGRGHRDPEDRTDPQAAAAVRARAGAVRTVGGRAEGAGRRGCGVREHRFKTLLF